MASITTQQGETSGRSPSLKEPRSWQARVVRDCSILVAVMLFAELVVRTYDPRYTTHLYDHEFTGGHPIAMNEQGFRGQAIELMRAPGVTRVFAVGDSVTFGVGAAWEDAWPARLSVNLTDRGVSNEVWNAGMPTMDVKQITHALKNEWSRFCPDVVVLALTGNMASLGWIRRNVEVSAPRNEFVRGERARTRIEDAKVEVNRIFKKIALPSFILRNGERAIYWIGLADHLVDPTAPRGVMVAHGWRQMDLPVAVVTEAWSIVEQDLRDLRDVADGHGIRLIVTYAPPRFMISMAAVDNEKSVPRNRLSIDPVEQARGICGRLNIQWSDALGALRNARRRAAESSGQFESLYLQGDYTHLDASGHQAVADALASVWATEVDSRSSAPRE